jgi:hypothetical protein
MECERKRVLYCQSVKKKENITWNNSPFFYIHLTCSVSIPFNLIRMNTVPSLKVNKCLCVYIFNRYLYSQTIVISTIKNPKISNDIFTFRRMNGQKIVCGSSDFFRSLLFVILRLDSYWSTFVKLNSDEMSNSTISLLVRSAWNSFSKKKNILTSTSWFPKAYAWKYGEN